MNTSNYIAVIADDLTGANDTSLQFFLKGASTQVSFGQDILINENFNTEVFAVSTNTRNINQSEAKQKVLSICENVLKKYSFEHIYKKIDSVLRGNIAVEIMTILDSLNFDAAVIFPSFPNEGRTTIGGFQLLKGIPIQKTEFSHDPSFAITESNILNILKNQLSEQNKDITALIPLDIVMKGAGPILIAINDLISKGKKLIVVDAVSTTDLEQIALAISKCSYKILPSGSAGGAQALSDLWHPLDQKENFNLVIPKLPKFVVSGSATDLTASQIKRLKDSDSIDNIYFIPIKPENIILNDSDSMSLRILNNLINENTVVIHSSELIEDNEKLNEILLEKEISREIFISKICSYLAEVTRKVLSNHKAILITIGGETSCKCLQALGGNNILIKDMVAPAIPLGLYAEDKFVVTKSGNLGTQNTLIDIIRYFDRNL